MEDGFVRQNKVISLLNYAPRHEGVCGSGGMALRICKLNTK
jgi:hypothetical protein